MPFVPVPNTVLAEIRGTLDGQKIENTLYFDLGAEPESAAMTALGSDLFTWWGANVGPLVSIAFALREIVVTSLASDTGPQTTFTPTGPAGGGVTDEIMPNSVSMAVSFRTDNRGRSFRGRNYTLGVCTNQVTGNQFTSLYSDAYQAAYAALLDTPFGVGQQWVVVSRFSGIDPTTHKPIPRTTGLATPVTGVVITDVIVDSQRRRLPGRGQ